MHGGDLIAEVLQAQGVRFLFTLCGGHISPILVGWTQIAREQVEIFQDDVGTVLAHTNYHRVAEGFGGTGILLNDPTMIPEVLTYAREAASNGNPVLIHAILGKTDFRKGSISM